MSGNKHIQICFKKKSIFFTSAEDGGGHGHSLYVGHCGRATEEANVGGERGFETGLALAALERLNQSSLLTADVGA